MKVLFTFLFILILQGQQFSLDICIRILYVLLNILI